MMPFGSLNGGGQMPQMAAPQMPANGLDPMAIMAAIARMRGQAPGATPPAAPAPTVPGAGDPSATPGGLINRIMGMQGGGMLNKLAARFAPINPGGGVGGQLGGPGATVPDLPLYDPNAPGPNALTGMW